jgi:hypothetical protein
MADRLLHLPFKREAPQNPRRAGHAFFPKKPDDPAGHATRLALELAAVETVIEREPAFDPRRLIKLELEGLDPQDLEIIPGLRVVSQEGRTAVVFLATDEGIDDFKKRLTAITTGGPLQRANLIYAVKAIGVWTAEDRKGSSLRLEGPPHTAEFNVDVELWPLERDQERKALLSAFDSWCRDSGINVLDGLERESVVLRRVRLSQSGLHLVLHHRDVRLVDLPPRYQFAWELVREPIEHFPPVGSPPTGSPGVAVLDSGLASAHPMLAAAVGDSQSFLPEHPPTDDNGHGTRVAGLALYGDVEQRVNNRSFVPTLRLFSGRITDHNAQNDQPKLVENAVIEAVKYFKASYGCRVFNLSFGDTRRVYADTHVGQLAAVIDDLARSEGVLFVVSAGNFEGTGDVPRDWLAEYPSYLGAPDARILDPAPAINALTIGSLARREVTRMSGRFPKDPAYQPIARRGQPSPFTRSGPGPRGAIKPELVEFGGNWSVDRRTNTLDRSTQLGELSTAHDFATGNLFALCSGTSYAAPKVAHLAATLIGAYPGASNDLVRALLVAHAEVPEASQHLLTDEDQLRALVGYGRPEPGRVIESSERRVTLISEDQLAENAYHFYEIPIPEDFFKPPARRPRRIRVALAYTPKVRRTRLDYRTSSFSFRVVRRKNLDDVVNTFKRMPLSEQEPMIKEAGEFLPCARRRGKGTVQAATWNITQVDKRWAGQKLFLVVSRSVPKWARDLTGQENYALTVAIEDLSEVDVHFYTQVRERLGIPIPIPIRVRLG